MRMRRATTTGSPDPGAGDILGAFRTRTRDALRRVALRESDRTLRAAALVALGRVGDDEDARIFLDLLRRRAGPDDLLEAAAVGLGILPAIPDPETATAVRGYFQYALDNPSVLPHRAHGLLVLAAGLRARSDRSFAMALAGRSASPGSDAEEAALLSVACGLSGDPMLLPELVRAVRRGTLGTVDLGDRGRSHAIYALAKSGLPGAGPAIRSALASRRSGIESRRAAALGLGRLLRFGLLGEEDLREAPLLLLKTFRDTNDAPLKGFCAVALGESDLPAAVEELARAIDHGGSADLKPFAAFGLALSARGRESDAARRTRAFLREELDKSNDPELGAAFSIAVGLAGAREAEAALIERLGSKGSPDSARGAAALGLGILGVDSPASTEALRAAFDVKESAEVAGEAALALGLLGHRAVGKELVSALRQSDSETLQARALLALGHLSNRETVEPLLEILESRGEKEIVREYAAVALGLLGDLRDRDLLFSLDADFNYLATVSASRELIRLY